MHKIVQKNCVQIQKNSKAGKNSTDGVTCFLHFWIYLPFNKAHIPVIAPGVARGADTVAGVAATLGRGVEAAVAEVVDMAAFEEQLGNIRKCQPT